MLGVRYKEEQPKSTYQRVQKLQIEMNEIEKEESSTDSESVFYREF